MATTKQSKKRIRTNDERRVRNKNRSSAMKTHMKRVGAAIEAKDATTAEREFLDAQQRIDKAAKKNIIHANKAARLKSQLARRIAALKAAPSA